MEKNILFSLALFVSMFLSLGMVSGVVPVVEDISNPSISLVANETNNTQQVICEFSDDNGYSDIVLSSSYLNFTGLSDMGAVYFDDTVNDLNNSLTSEIVNVYSDNTTSRYIRLPVTNITSANLDIEPNPSTTIYNTYNSIPRGLEWSASEGVWGFADTEAGSNYIQGLEFMDTSFNSIRVCNVSKYDDISVSGVAYNGTYWFVGDSMSSKMQIWTTDCSYVDTKTLAYPDTVAMDFYNDYLYVLNYNGQLTRYDSSFTEVNSYNVTGDGFTRNSGYNGWTIVSHNGDTDYLNFYNDNFVLQYKVNITNMRKWSTSDFFGVSERNDNLFLASADRVVETDNVVAVNITIWNSANTTRNKEFGDSDISSSLNYNINLDNVNDYLDGCDGNGDGYCNLELTLNSSIRGKIGISNINFGIMPVVDDVSQINTTYGSASVLIDDIPYYKSPGNYSVTCEVNDVNFSDSLTENISVNTLLASDVNVGSVDFGSLSPGGSSSSSIFEVENYGNVELNSSWNATDFTSGSDSINISSVDLVSSRFGTLGLSNIKQTYGQAEVWRMLNGDWDIGNPEQIGYFDHSGYFVPSGFIIVDSGRRMYTVDGGGQINQFNLSTPWDVTSASHINTISSNDGTPNGIYVKSDGTRMYTIGSVSDQIIEWNLSDPWNLTTATVLNTKGAGTISASDIGVSADGTKIYAVDGYSSKISTFNLTDAWNVSTASQIHTTSNLEGGSLQGFYIKPDGTKFWTVTEDNLLEHGTVGVRQYSLSKPWDMSTLEFEREYLDGYSHGSQLMDVLVTKDSMYTSNAFDRYIKQYSLNDYLNPKISYNSHFEFSIPPGTPAGSYSNVFTHSISQT